MYYVSLYRGSSISPKETPKRPVKVGVRVGSPQEAERMVVNAFEGEQVKFKKHTYKNKTYCYIGDECVGCISISREGV